MEAGQQPAAGTLRSRSESQVGVSHTYHSHKSLSAFEQLKYAHVLNSTPKNSLFAVTLKTAALYGFAD